MFGWFSGIKVVFKNLFKKPITVQYPEKREVNKHYHGKHQLNRYEDGLEKCIGCELCAWVCPADAIYVEGAENSDQERYSPGERYAKTYEINYSRCILCGLCVEACPTRAITMTDRYDDWSSYDRKDMVYDKNMLLAPLEEGMKKTPQISSSGDYREYTSGVYSSGEKKEKKEEGL